MMLLRARIVTLALLVLIGLVQTELWFSRGGVRHVLELQSRRASQKAANDAARSRNDQLVAEVRDLEQGLEMVEEKARSELGMVRRNEILVQVTRPLP